MAEQSQGLGDTAKKVIATVTAGLVKPCSRCEQRRQWLNKKFPYRNSTNEEKLAKLKDGLGGGLGPSGGPST